ncbi:MAG: ClbS/DfsB family four-helix bundle protein [Thermales bacterium]|nr:ClbS/DfsB family four-helix bundle protein [Thermales bacterium]
MEERDDKEMYKSRLYDWTNTWKLGRYCESSGFKPLSKC